MDYSTILVAVISFAGTVFGSYMINNKTSALLQYRLQQLEAKVDKHNNVVERMALAETNLKSVWRNIDEIKEELHKEEH